MTKVSSDFHWFDQLLTTSVFLGEFSLLKSSTYGLRCHPDIFDMPPLLSLKSVLDDVKDRKPRLAFIYSCPVERNCVEIAISDGYVAFIDNRYRHFYVNTGQDFKKYLEPRNKRTISTLRRKVKKVEATNPDGSSIEIYSRVDEMDCFLAKALPVAEKSYQRRLLGQGLPSHPSFLSEIKTKAERGEMLAYTLQVGGRTVAYNLCPIYGGSRVLYDHTGFDPDYSDFSPGAVLQFKIIEDLCYRDGLNYYDLCTGEGQHKEMFATDSVHCANIFIFPLVSRQSLFFIFRWVVAKTLNIPVRLLDRLGLKSTLKKLFRRSV